MKELNTFREFLNENEDDGYDRASKELFDMTWDEVRRENDPRMRQAVHDEVQKDDDTYIDDVQENQSSSQELNTFRKFLKENSREVKVTEDQKSQILKAAQDLENIVKIHDGVEGTRLLNARMQDRDVLIKAARVLKNLVELLNKK